MIFRDSRCSSQLVRIFSIFFGPRPLIWVSIAGDLSITSSVFSPNTSTMRWANFGPMPFTSPEPRYLAIPSAVCGGFVFSSVALNWRPCERSVTHSPVAVTYSPAITCWQCPMTVTRSRCPRAATRSTQYPLSSLWNVIRSITPVICSATFHHKGTKVAQRTQRKQRSRTKATPQGHENRSGPQL